MNKYWKITDFEEARAEAVGSSDVPTLAGLNKRYSNLYEWRDTRIQERLPSTVRTLWLEKTKRVRQIPDPEKGEKMEWGNLLEPLILKKFIARQWGEAVAHEFYRNATRADPVSSGPFKVKIEASHPQYPFAMAHTDLLVDGELDGVQLPLMIVEAKSAGFMAGKRRDASPGDGYSEDDHSQFGIPDKVFMQVQWQLFCLGVQEAYVATLIDTSRFQIYGPVIYDPRHVEKSLALAQAFWALVESDTEPAPSTWDDVVSSYPDLENKTAMVSGEAEMKARQMRERGYDIKENMKREKEELEDIKAGFGILAGDTVEVIGKDEDGNEVKRLKRTMNKVLNDSSGNKLASFRDQTTSTLSLSEFLEEIEKKQSKRATQEKRLAEGKPVDPVKWADSTLTEQEERILKLDAELRALGAYKTSESFRVVTY